jgi:hypothetical protein
MAAGDVKDRRAGQHDDVDLTPEELAAFNQMASSAEDEELQAHTYRNQQEAGQAGVSAPSMSYTPTTSPYDSPGYNNGTSDGNTRRMGGVHDGGTRRAGGATRRDPGQHAGYTRDYGKDDKNNLGGFTRRDLKNAEEDGGKHGDSNPVADLMNREQGSDTPFSYKNTGPKWAKGRGFLQKHKKKVIAGALAGVGIFPLLALLLFILGALKIPHFAENVAAWRFAAVTRQYRKSMNNVMSEKAAYDSLSDEDKLRAQTRYGKYAAFDKVNRLRPNRVLQNLHANDRLQYNYKTTLLGRQKLSGVTIAIGDDLKSKVTVDIPTSKFKTVFENPLKRMDRYKDISTALNAAMKAHDPKISVVTRSLVTKAVLAKAGARLSGMAASKYTGQANQTEQLNKLYASMVDNAKKYNALVEQYTSLANQLDSVYSAQANTKEEWKAAYAVLIKADNNWEATMARIGGANAPDADELTRAFGEFDQAKQNFLDHEDKLSDFNQRTKDMRAKMDTISKDLTKLAQERASLRESFKTSGGTISDRDAKIAIQQEAYERAHRNGGIAGMKSGNLKDVAQDVDEAEDAAMKDREQVGQMVDKGQDIPDAASQALERGTSANSLRAVVDKVVGFANPIYDIAVPICLAYEGSRLSGDSVDADHDAKVSETTYVLSTADQFKDGTKANTAMAQAMNWKLGNVRDSNAIRRQEGRPANTLGGVGGQRTTLGTYGGLTIFDVFGLGGLNSVADDLCPTVTNIWVGVGLGVVSLVGMGITTFFSGGTAAVGVAATKEAAEEAVKKTVTKMVTNATKKALKSFGKAGRFGKELGKSTVKYGAIAAGATFMAQMIVAHKAGALNSGAEKDVSFDDNVDDGASQLSGDVNRANFMARPLNGAEVVQSHKLDRDENAYYNSHLSPYERYLALENPQSLATRVATTAGTLVDKSIFASLLNGMASLFNPVGLGSKLFANVNGTTALADGNVNTEDYGNVVWGYSYEEQKLMDQPSYASPSENELRLDQSGKEEEIAGKYQKCYDDTIGKLLEEHDIKRDENGNVLNGSDCSPEELGPNNPEYGDLVFRWRLKGNYSHTTDNLINIQDPSAVADTTLADLGNIPTGTTKELAQKILDSANISFQTPAERDAMEYIASTGHARTCGNTSTSPKLLGILLAASSKYKIVIGVLTDGHGCTSDEQTHAHAKGLAADINGVNPLSGSGGTGNMIDAGELQSNSIVKQFYGDLGNIVAQAGGGEIGQVQCVGNPDKNPKVHYFNDVCNHIHVDVVGNTSN